MDKVAATRMLDGNRSTTLLDAVATPVMVLDSDGRILHLNPACEQLSGYACSEAVGRTIWELFIPPKDSGGVREVLQALVCSGSSGPHKTRWLDRKGMPHLIAWSYAVVPDEHGRSVIVATGREAGDGRELEHAVSTLEERYWSAIEEASRAVEEFKADHQVLGTLLDYIPAGVIIADAPDVRVRMISRYAQMMTGKPYEVLVRVTLEELPFRWNFYRADGITPARAEELPLVRAIQKGELVTSEEWVLERIDGRKSLVLCSAAPIYDGDGIITAGVVVWDDITELKASVERRRELELETVVVKRLAEEREQLARDLHDGLKQQLVGMNMLARNIHKLLQKQSPKALPLMGDFVHTIADANSLVSRLISGIGPVQVSEHNLKAALERSAAEIERWYHVPVRVTYDSDVALEDDSVANHLFHIAHEAMINAGKSSQAGSVAVSIEKAHHGVRLTVEDDGVGLPDDYDQRGGMGVASMRKRAELIGATLVFGPAEQRGTVVTCMLPL